MKKVYVSAYLKKNLGDDLFVKILCDRYKSTKFYILADKSYKEVFKDTNNICVINNKNIIIRLLNKMCMHNLENILKIFSNAWVMIGGSIFMEPDNWCEDKEKIKRKLKKTFRLKKKLYILGCNFGPYSYEDYLEFYKKEIFKGCRQISFRETFSYNLFKDINNVSYYPDIVFTLNKEDISIKNGEKTAVISFIDLKSRSKLSHLESDYISAIAEIAKYFNRAGYKINLMSFCKEEKDEDMIVKMGEELSARKIEYGTYLYNGNIPEALNFINNSDVMVASRFHAAILGLLLNKKTIPISYSNKTTNVLKDIKFNSNIIELRDINKFNLDQIQKNLKSDLNFEHLTTEANGHFMKLDEILDK